MNRKKDIIQLINNELPQVRIKTDDLSLSSYGRDSSAYFDPNPVCILFPVSTAEVIEIVEFANKHKYPIVPSGGRTGLSAAATATNGEIVLSFEKMDQILRYNEEERTVEVQAGLVISRLQEFAKSKGLYYPIEYAATASSQVGGNIATNAGGIHVIRYGMTRDWIRGLEVVSGRGVLLKLNKGLVKNASGYDLRHLFIGSEGTLGLITEATIQLCAAPKEPSTFLLGVKDLEKLSAIFIWMNNHVQLLAFEFFSDLALRYALEEEQIKYALSGPYEYYAIIEFDALLNENIDSRESRESRILIELSDSGLIAEGTLALDISDRKNLWAHRELIPVSINKYQPYKFDVSVRVSRLHSFILALENLTTEHPDMSIVFFGHYGDGNIHINIPCPTNMDREEFQGICEVIGNKIYQLIRTFEGSISAEHGIGLIKKNFLSFSRSPEEIDYMKSIKATFDPNNILNPGKIF